MKNLYLGTAMILTMAGAAVAQTATTTEAPAADAPAAEAAAAAPAPAADAASAKPGEAMKTGLLRASALDGADVYTIDVTGKAVWNDGETYAEIDTNWDKIGEVEDLVFDPAGNVVGAIAEVGGFLGIGEKEVMLLPEEIAFAVTPDRIAVVSALSKEALEQREKYAEDAEKAAKAQ